MNSPLSAATMLRPKSIAIVGASAERHSPGGGVLANLQQFSFAGDIHLVNKNRTEINGHPCVAAVSDLPFGIDVAVLVIPQAAIVGAVEQCAERGIRSVMIFASGFAEAGDEGRLAQTRIAEIAREHNMLVGGPNCLGYVNFVDGIPLTFGAVTPRASEDRAGLAVLSQSGAMSSVLRFACNGRNLPVTYAISTGNEVGLGVEDYLEYLIDDSSTQLITLYVEQFRRPQKLLELARKARTAGKPIVLLHPGRSEASRKSAESHTGALAGDYKVMRTLIERAGILAVDSIEELIDVSELLFRYPAPSAGTAVITDSGAFKGLTLDYADSIGLDLPTIEGATEAALRKILPIFVDATNPLDLTAQAMRDADLYHNTLMPLLDDDRFGSVVLGVILGSLEASEHRGKRILASIPAKPKKPVIITVLGDDGPISEDIVREIREAKLPFFRSPERALRALALVTRYGKSANHMADHREQPTAATVAEQGVIPEYKAKAIFNEIRIPVPTGALATSLDEARAIARKIGFPVVLKAQSKNLSHKSDAGGVVANIREDEGLATAWAQVNNGVMAKTGIQLDGILVETMATSGQEIILGAKRDPQWGAVIIVGLGGIWTELLHDIVIMPTDCSHAEIITRLRSLKAGRLFDGYRGQGALDIGELATVVEKLSRFVEANPTITEIDINPLIVREQGQGVLALDALIVTGTAG